MTKMIPNIMFVSLQQYGYLTDLLQISSKIGRTQRATVVCWDYSLDKVDRHNVDVHYVSRSGSRLVRMRRFFVHAAHQIRSRRPDLVFIDYFLGCSLLKLLAWNMPMIVDIRTADVSNSRFSRLLHDAVMRCECSIFPRITVISAGVRDQLKLPREKSRILPLGADRMAWERKSFESLHLLYVGTLSNRRIDDTISAFARFVHLHKEEHVSRYTIIGFGTDAEIESIRATIVREGVEDVVRFVGRVPFWELGPYLERANVGVAYVPMTDYYTHQPPTKVFEYLLSGLAVIGTNTVEIQKVVTATNGVLVDDNVESFYHGLERLYAQRSSFDSERIAKESARFSWDRIVSDRFMPIIDEATGTRQGGTAPAIDGNDAWAEVPETNKV